MIQKLPVKTILPELQALPINVLLVLNHDATQRDPQSIFNLPAMAIDLLGDWPQPSAILNVRIWAPGWDADQLRRYLGDAAQSEKRRASSFLGLADAEGPERSETARYEIVHFIGNVGSFGFDRGPLLSVGGTSLAAGALRDAFVRSKTRLFILQLLEKRSNLGEQLAEFVAGAGGPAVLVVGEGASDLGPYLYNLYAAILRNQPLGEAAAAPASGPSTLLVCGIDGDQLLQFHGLIGRLAERLDDYSSLVKALLERIGDIGRGHLQVTHEPTPDEIQLLRELDSRIDTERTRLLHARKSVATARLLSIVVTNVSSISEDIGFHLGEGPLHTRFDLLAHRLGLPVGVAPRAPRPGAAAGSEATNAEYTVWYGTNRAQNDPSDPSKGYSARRDTVVRYGSCRVFVPTSHKIGSIGSPWWKRLLTGKDDRLRLRAVQELVADGYWGSLAKHLDTVDLSERNGMVFIHGYNVTFEDAALRAAQIGFDLSIRGAMAFFSWPSQGTLGGYLADAATIDACEDAITEFLVDFSERSGARTTHIIAHSMGNRAVLRAVDRIAQRTRRRAGKRFGQVILAAADVDADVFRQRCAAYTRLARRATLYVSTRDFAVEASRWLHDAPRAGLMPPVLVVPGIDTINVANVDLTQLGHGYIAEARDVLADIHHLLRQDTPPEHRFGLRAMDAQDGAGRFWCIGA